MTDDPDGTVGLAGRRARRHGRRRGCPICGKPTIKDLQPFCSARCRQVDLGRWFSGSYRVETEEQPEDSSAPKTPEASPSND